MVITKDNFKKNNLNLIQFIMAILVIYSHAFPIATAQNGGEILKDLTEAGYSSGNLAVAAFFIISGFLVSASYEDSPGIFQYLLKRAFRIFPALFAVVVFSAFILGPLVTSLPLQEYLTDAGTWQYVKTVFLYPVYWELPGVFEQNLYGNSVNGSLWTIPYQFGLYLMLGIVGFLRLNKYRRVSFSMLCAFIFAYLMRDDLFSNITQLFGMPLRDWLYLGMYFTAGMTAYSYRDSIKLDRQGAMVSLSLMLFAWCAKEYFVSTAIFGTYLILYLGYCTKHVKFPMDKLSFGIYLYGFPIQQMFTHLFGGSMDPYLNMILSIPIVLLLAYVSNRFVESPIAKLEKYISLKPLIPQFVYSGCEMIRSAWEHMLQRIIAISWREYGVILLISGVAVWGLFIDLPSGVEFTENRKNPARALAQGYFDQNEGETFTFVTDVSCVKLGQKRGMDRLEINGFLPETFTDVNTVTVYYNGSPILESGEVTAGQGFSFLLTVPNHEMLMEKKAEIKLIFNTVHQMEPDSADIRQLSACITSIRFRGSAE